MSLQTKINHLKDILYYRLIFLNKSKIRVLSITETLKQIKVTGKSVSRFGDGELRWIMKERTDYYNQHVTPEFTSELAKALNSPNPNVLIGLPGSVFNGLDEVTNQNKAAWQRLTRIYGKRWLEIINNDRVYIDANFSRPYIDRKDKSEATLIFSMMKDLWNDRDVLIIEGNQTKFGVGNDLLKSAKSVSRIEAPAENAFDNYSEILEVASSIVDSGYLVLVALGPTATILVNDLAKLGVQAIDIGNADIEYEWFLKQSDERVAVPGKYVNEVERSYVGEIDDLKTFNSEVVASVEG